MQDDFRDRLTADFKILELIQDALGSLSTEPPKLPKP